MAVEKKYYLVKTKEDVELLLEHLSESEEVAVDTETTSLNTRKGKIVGWSISGASGVGFYFPVYVWNPVEQELEEQSIGGKSAREITTEIFKILKTKKLITHNGAFDTSYILNDYGIDLTDSLWVETTLLVHTVREEGVGIGSFRLKDIAIAIQAELGLDVEKAANQEQIELKESIKKNGGTVTKSDFEIYKADLDILGKYGAADTDLTYRICMYYLPKLQEENLEQFFFVEEVMPIYKEVTIPMERMGVDLDMELLRKTDADITRDLEENKGIVLRSLLNEPEAQAWVINSALKAYPPSNRGTWAQAYVSRYSLPIPKSPKTGKYSITKASIAELEDGEAKEFLSTGNLDLLDPKERVKISMALWKDLNGGEYLNIQSTKHLGEIVFDYFGEKPKSTTEKGKNQFDMVMIEELSKKYEWAENLRVYNKLLKIKSTYIDRFLEGSEDGKYYFYFKQHGTVSGRYGSDAQQMPKPREEGQDTPLVVHYTNLVRAFMIAGPGRKIIDTDYSSLEPRVFSSLTQDKGLMEIYEKGWDFYSTIAIQAEKLNEDTKSYPNGVSPDPTSPLFLKKLNPVARNKAKAYSLGLAYGMSAYALAKNLKIKQKEASVLHEGYLNGFPKLREWMNTSRAFVKKNGYIRNKVGRIRHLPVVKEVYEAFGDKLMDYQFREDLHRYHGISKDEIIHLYGDYRNQLNNALNFQIQSLGASIVNRAALHINRKAKELGIDARVQAQIHDQLIVNVREDQAAMFAPHIQEIMEHNIELEGVKLIAEPMIGDNWLETH